MHKENNNEDQLNTKIIDKLIYKSLEHFLMTISIILSNKFTFALTLKNHQRDAFYYKNKNYRVKIIFSLFMIIVK